MQYLVFDFKHRFQRAQEHRHTTESAIQSECIFIEVSPQILRLQGSEVSPL